MSRTETVLGWVGISAIIAVGLIVAAALLCKAFGVLQP